VGRTRPPDVTKESRNPFQLARRVGRSQVGHDRQRPRVHRSQGRPSQDHQNAHRSEVPTGPDFMLLGYPGFRCAPPWANFRAFPPGTVRSEVRR
jgi:hypothetical protein